MYLSQTCRCSMLHTMLEFPDSTVVKTSGLDTVHGQAVQGSVTGLPAFHSILHTMPIFQTAMFLENPAWKQYLQGRSAHQEQGCGQLAPEACQHCQARQNGCSHAQVVLELSMSVKWAKARQKRSPRAGLLAACPHCSKPASTARPGMMAAPAHRLCLNSQ